MFCTSLRRRPSIAPVISKLTGPQNLGVRESQLNTNDIALPLAVNTDPRTGSSATTRQFRVLLFSPSGTIDDRLAETVERIRRFAALTGGQDLAIVFLLDPPKDTAFTSAKNLNGNTGNPSPGQDGVIAYSKLQAAMMDHGDIPHIHVLPLTTLDALPELLKKHVAALSQPKQRAKPPTTPFTLLQMCTANPPMSQQTAFILSDLFPNLRELAVACASVSSAPISSSPSVRAAGFSSQVIGTQDTGRGMSTQYSADRAVNKLKQLRDLVGDQEVMDIVDFWKEEYTVD